MKQPTKNSSTRRAHAGKVAPRSKAPAGRAATRGRRTTAATATRGVAKKPAAAKRVMTQPTKAELRAQIAHLEETVTKLRSAAKDLRGELKSACRDRDQAEGRVHVLEASAERIEPVTAENKTLKDQVSRLQAELAKQAGPVGPVA